VTGLGLVGETLHPASSPSPSPSSPLLTSELLKELGIISPEGIIHFNLPSLNAFSLPKHLRQAYRRMEPLRMLAASVVELGLLGFLCSTILDRTAKARKEKVGK